MQTQTQKPTILGPHQLEWCRQKFGTFSIIEKQAKAALEDTRNSHRKYPVTHERKPDQ